MIGTALPLSLTGRHRQPVISKTEHTVSIMELLDGKVVRETRYFAEAFDAPLWIDQ